MIGTQKTSEKVTSHIINKHKHKHKHVRICELLECSLDNASAIKVHELFVYSVDRINEFRILYRGGSRDILDIKESIMIKKMKLSLNDNIGSASLSLYN